MPRANRHFLSGHVWHITHRRTDRRSSGSTATFRSKRSLLLNRAVNPKFELSSPHRLVNGDLSIPQIQVRLICRQPPGGQCPVQNTAGEL